MFDVIPKNGQTWLICGGRDFTDQAAFDAAMGVLIRMKGDTVCLHRLCLQGVQGYLKNTCTDFARNVSGWRRNILGTLLTDADDRLDLAACTGSL